MCSIPVSYLLRLRRLTNVVLSDLILVTRPNGFFRKLLNLSEPVRRAAHTWIKTLRKCLMLPFATTRLWCVSSIRRLCLFDLKTEEELDYLCICKYLVLFHVDPRTTEMTEMDVFVV